jgi:hypothetical protein
MSHRRRFAGPPFLSSPVPPAIGQCHWLRCSCVWVRLLPSRGARRCTRRTSSASSGQQAPHVAYGCPMYVCHSLGRAPPCSPREMRRSSKKQVLRPRKGPAPRSNPRSPGSECTTRRGSRQQLFTKKLSLCAPRPVFPRQKHMCVAPRCKFASASYASCRSDSIYIYCGVDTSG